MEAFEILEFLLSLNFESPYRKYQKYSPSSCSKHYHQCYWFLLRQFALDQFVYGSGKNKIDCWSKFENAGAWRIYCI